MVENQLCSLYSGSFDEVYGLNDYENIYYNAPEETSISGSGLFYYQTDFVYDPAFYVQPSYQVYYPVIPVAYSADYYNQTYVPVFSGYYMPFYYLPSNLYNVSDMYPGQVYESPLVSSSAEQNSFTYEEFDSGLYYTANGFYNDSYESFEEVVGEASTTCHLFYEEGPEELNGDPNDDEVNNNSSNNRVNNDEVSSPQDIHESTAVQIDDGGHPCTTNTNPCEVDDVAFLKSLSAADFTELKAEIDGTYNQLKENLYNDVTRGYTKMKEFLKNVKWKWDRCLYTIREEEKVKKSFDMDFEYYFHDVIRIPKGRVRYEDPAEKYILYQMLGSLEMDDLKRFMELNYDNGKKRLYKDECTGFFKIEKQLKKLKWERSSLCRITDGVELKITKKAFVRNFIRGLRNITSEKSKDLHYLLDVLKKSVLTSTPESEESEEVQDVFTEEGIDPDCQLMKEHPQLSVSSSDSEEGEIPYTPDVSLSTEDFDVESQNVTEDLELVSSSCIAEVIKSDPVPRKTELSLSDKDSESEKIEEKQDVFTEEGIAPDSQLMKEHPRLSVSSSDSEEGEVHNTPDIALSKEELDGSQKVIEDLELVSSSCIAEDIKSDFVPRKTEHSLSDKDSESEKIEEKHTSSSSVEKMGKNERPFAPPVIEMDAVKYVSFREEELYPVSRSSTDASNLDVSSPDIVEEKSSSPPSVILDSEVLAAASEKCHHKKRFSSLRKILSRICCCRKRPPS